MSERWKASRDRLRLPVALVSMLFASQAAAHAPPEIHAIQRRQGGSDEQVLLTNRGLIFDDGAGKRRLMCNVALGINSSERPDYQLREDGRLIVATSVGLRVSDDGGCTWQPHGQFVELATTAMTWHDDDPTTLWLAIRLPEGENAVFQSTDGGEVWSQIATLPEGVGFDEMLVAPGDPSRLYASGIEVDSAAMAFHHFVAASTDGGASWTRHEIMLADNEGDLELMAVDPGNVDRIVLKAQDNGTGALDRVLISDDAGGSVETGGEVPMFRGAAFSPDGSTLWIAAEDGLHRSLDGGATLEAVPGTLDLTCVYHDDQGVRVCGLFEGDLLGGDGIGRSPDGVAPFTPLLTFDQVDAPVECDACSETSLECTDLWDDWALEVLGIDEVTPAPACDGSAAPMPTATGDAGAPTADAPPVGGAAAGEAADPGPAESSGGDGGCAVASPGRRLPGRAVWPGLALGVLGIGASRARRRRRPAPARRSLGSRQGL